MGRENIQFALSLDYLPIDCSTLVRSEIFTHDKEDVFFFNFLSGTELNNRTVKVHWDNIRVLSLPRDITSHMIIFNCQKRFYTEPGIIKI